MLILQTLLGINELCCNISLKHHHQSIHILRVGTNLVLGQNLTGYHIAVKYVTLLTLA